MRLFRCKHRRLSLPVSNRRHCVICGQPFAYDALTLTEADREQARTITTLYDASNIANKKTSEVVRPINRKQERK